MNAANSWSPGEHLAAGDRASWSAGAAPRSPAMSSYGSGSSANSSPAGSSAWSTRTASLRFIGSGQACEPMWLWMMKSTSGPNASRSFMNRRRRVRANSAVDGPVM